jgi:hypothetical protein
MDRPTPELRDRDEEPVTMDAIEPPAADYGRVFDPSEVRTLEGTISDVGTFDAGRTGLEGLRLRVNTEEHGLVTVYAGPRDYFTRQNVFFASGDEVTITGAPVQVGWRSIFLASRITLDDQTLELRDQAGRPMWQHHGEHHGQQPGAGGGWATRPGALAHVNDPCTPEAGVPGRFAAFANSMTREANRQAITRL